MKFTDEQWSRILSAHASGQLDQGPHFWPVDDSCCAQEAAFVQCWHYMKTYTKKNFLVAKRFDLNYSAKWTPEQLIKNLSGY